MCADRSARLARGRSDIFERAALHRPARGRGAVRTAKVDVLQPHARGVRIRAPCMAAVWKSGGDRIHGAGELDSAVILESKVRWPQLLVSVCAIRIRIERSPNGQTNLPHPQS